MVRNWAQNLSHAQTLRTDLRLNPLSGHEIVAKKRVPNPDRVFGEKVEVSVAFLYWDGRLAFLLTPVRWKQSWGDWEIERRLLGLGASPWEEEVWGAVLAATCLSRKETPPLSMVWFPPLPL